MPRDFNHDYRSRSIYHITINKAQQIPDFCTLSGTPECICNTRSPIGEIIEKNIRRFSTLSPRLRVLQYVIMPDHIHFILFVTDYIERAVGSYIGMMKVKIGQEIRATFPQYNLEPIFRDDFYDRILRPTHSLDAIYRYIRLNPYRLRVRQLNPDFFKRINNLTIREGLWQAYGNIHLLDNPFKRQVVVHRADSEAIKAKNRADYIYYAANGCVLVSPFISPAEKEIRKEAEANGGKIILLSNEPMSERAKPSGHNFELCEQGRLLILAPKEKMQPGRQTFLYLNSIAEYLASAPNPATQASQLS